MNPRTSHLGKALVYAGTFATPVSQWFLLYLFTREGLAAAGKFSLLFSVAVVIFVISNAALRDVYLSLRERLSWWTYLLMRVIGAAAGGLALIVTGMLVGAEEALLAGMVLLKVCDAILDMIQAKLQDELRLHALGISALVGATFTSGSALAAATFTGSATVGLIAAALARIPVAAVTLAVAARPMAAAQRRDDEIPLRVVAEPAVLLTVGHLVTALAAYLPVWLIAWWTGNAETIGAWSTAAYILVAANLVGVGFRTHLLPTIRVGLDAGATLSHAWALARRGVVTIVPWCAAGFAATVLAGDTVLGAVYGPDFRIGRGVLVPLGLAAVAAVLSVVLGTMTLAANRFRRQTGVALAAVVDTVVMAQCLHLSGVDPLPAVAWGVATGATTRVLGLLYVSLHAVRTERTVSTPSLAEPGGPRP